MVDAERFICFQTGFPLALKDAIGSHATTADYGTVNLGQIPAPSTPTPATNAPWSIVCTTDGTILTVNLRDITGADFSATNTLTLYSRNATLSSGIPSAITLNAAINMTTVAAGASLGTPANKAIRYWVALFNNGGSPVLSLINCKRASGAGIYRLFNGLYASTTAISAGATSAATFYTPSGVTLANKPFIILGYIEWDTTGLATPGTFTRVPDFVHEFIAGTPLPGDIINTKYGSTSTRVGEAAGSIVSGGLTATIDPISAANLIQVDFSILEAYSDTAGSTYGNFWIRRGGTSIQQFTGVLGLAVPGGSSYYAPFSGKLLDNPNSLSSQVYDDAIQRAAGAGTIAVQNNGGTSTMLLSEIMS